MEINQLLEDASRETIHSLGKSKAYVRESWYFKEFGSEIERFIEGKPWSPLGNQRVP